MSERIFPKSIHTAGKQMSPTDWIEYTENWTSDFIQAARAAFAISPEERDRIVNTVAVDKLFGFYSAGVNDRFIELALNIYALPDDTLKTLCYALNFNEEMRGLIENE